jgi:hypothetical protein
VGRGLLRWEAFYRGRPSSYWREVLREDGKNGALRVQTVDTFGGRSAAVLAECLQDPDPNVRWPAAYLLGHNGDFAPRIVPPLRRALQDPNQEVRLQAIRGLGLQGPNALAAKDDLAQLYQDPDAQVQHFADVALWQVHVPTALRAGGWQEFRSPEWGFTVTFPEAPELKQRPLDSPQGPLVAHSFEASHGVTRCLVCVTEYPEQFVHATTLEQRLAAADALVGVGLEAKVVHDQPIEQSPHVGRELVIETALGMVRNRVFWVGRRQYTFIVVFDRRFLNGKAAEYFLDSVRIDQ